jgi:hypothetical protein
METKQYFTLVFEGEIRKFDGNPLRTETPFGVPVAAGIGNAFETIDRLELALDEASFNATCDWH